MATIVGLGGCSAGMLPASWPSQAWSPGVPADDQPRSSSRFSPRIDPKAGLETPVGGLERIVRIGLRAVEGRGAKEGIGETS